jgi:hypothetical protein
MIVGDEDMEETKVMPPKYARLTVKLLDEAVAKVKRLRMRRKIKVYKKKIHSIEVED